MSADEPAAEAFREAADKRAALEARLTEEQRVRYLALRQKQEADFKRQEQRLEQRRQDYESEMRKHGIAPRLEMTPVDRNTPRALRDAAREYAAQDQWVADLRKAQERDRDRFLERAVAGKLEAELQRIEQERPRQRPSHE